MAARGHRGLRSHRARRQRRRPRLRRAQPARPVVRRERRRLGPAGAPRAGSRHHLHRHRPRVRAPRRSWAKAVRGRRDEVVISTKVLAARPGGRAARCRRHCAPRCRRRCRSWAPTGSTSTTCTAWVTTSTRECVAELVPELERLRDDGMIRFLAISERFAVRSRAHDVAARGRGRLLGRDDGGLQPAEPQRARPRVLGHA